MKLSRKWLNEFVDLPLDEIDDRAFDEAMTVSGSKVEVTEDLSAKMKNVKVGRILSLEKHPNSDHMLVAQLDVGEAEPVQICTGAWNVHVGDLVPAALHNALLPNGTKITISTSGLSPVVDYKVVTGAKPGEVATELDAKADANGDFTFEKPTNGTFFKVIGVRKFEAK